MAVKAAKGASGPNKKASLTECLLKERELDKALSLTEQGHKQPARENTTDKKELLMLSLGNVAEGS
jgi:hypothetical protein